MSEARGCLSLNAATAGVAPYLFLSSAVLGTELAHSISLQNERQVYVRVGVEGHLQRLFLAFEPHFLLVNPCLSRTSIGSSSPVFGLCLFLGGTGRLSLRTFFFFFLHLFSARPCCLTRDRQQITGEDRHTNIKFKCLVKVL